MPPEIPYTKGAGISSPSIIIRYDHLGETKWPQIGDCNINAIATGILIILNWTECLLSGEKSKEVVITL